MSDITVSGALKRLTQLRLDLRQCISLGAGGGSDTLAIATQLNPAMAILMVEAQNTHASELAALRRANPNVDYVICAASDRDGEVYFSNSSPTGGAVVPALTADAVVQSSRRVDTLVRERQWSGPFFLKFDTHGVECEILAGAEEILRRTHLIMMEVYNFKLNFVGGKNLTFDEMCIHMRSLGFRFVDLCSPLHRPGDGAFWQAHFFFIRSDHPIFNSNSFRAPALDQ